MFGVFLSFVPDLNVLADGFARILLKGQHSIFELREQTFGRHISALAQGWLSCLATEWLRLKIKLDYFIYYQHGSTPVDHYGYLGEKNVFMGYTKVSHLCCCLGMNNLLG